LSWLLSLEWLGTPPPPPDPENHAELFASLIPDNASAKTRPSVSKFIKKLDEIPEVSLPPSLPRKSAITLAKRGLVGQFTGLWPSPRSVQKWVECNWIAMTQGKIAIRFCGRGYYTFIFETKEDRNLIFRNSPYFMDSRGLYLKRWTPDFDPEMDIPNAVPVWVCLPHLPLHCWGDESVKAIGNAVGKYIDRSEPRENMHGKGLPEAIKIKVDHWTHIQQLDYEQLPFKCKVCHEYRHFANRCSKSKSNESIENEESPDGQWEQVKKKKSSSSQGPSSKPSLENPPPPSPPPPSSAPSFSSTSNPFESLEVEDPSSPPPSPRNNSLAVISSPSIPLPSPPPTIERILTRNKLKETSLPSNPPRKAGRKSGNNQGEKRDSPKNW